MYLCESTPTAEDQHPTFVLVRVLTLMFPSGFFFGSAKPPYHQRHEATFGPKLRDGRFLEHALLLLPERLRLCGAPTTPGGVRQHHPRRPLAPGVLPHG